MVPDGEKRWAASKSFNLKNKIEIVLDKIEMGLGGRKATSQEIEALSVRIANGIFPQWYAEVLMNYPLIDSCFHLDESDDVSELGVSLKVLSPEGILSESFECYPGIAASSLGYLPFGSCLEGSGDPYFLDLTDPNSVNPRLVRIPHESVIEEVLDERQIEVVSETLTAFFQEATIEA